MQVKRSLRCQSVCVASLLALLCLLPSNLLAQRTPPNQARGEAVLVHWQKPADRPRDLLIPIELARSLVDQGHAVTMVLSATMSGIALNEAKRTALSPDKLGKSLSALVDAIKERTGAGADAKDLQRKHRDPRARSGSLQVLVLVPQAVSAAQPIKLVVPGSSLTVAEFAKLLAHSDRVISF